MARPQPPGEGAEVVVPAWVVGGGNVTRGGVVPPVVAPVGVDGGV